MANTRKEPSVVLSRIYTRGGDKGTTTLGDLSRTAKTDPRLAAYADVDEANSAIGVAIALGDLDTALGERGAEIARLLTRVQNELFDVGADLCMPVTPEGDGERAGGEAQSTAAPLRVDESYVTRLERECDHYNADLGKLRSFVLPGGTPAAALLHAARTVVRRAERTTWAAIEAKGESIGTMPAKYLNRLSDLLFILARVANAEVGDVLWQPGGQR
jgi:cob(I)alamin adenosyltransferase